MFAEILRKWYEENQRSLPWRNSKDPYKIWVSEVILQQTRVVQGLEYYRRFINRFPDIKSLAFADEVEVLRLWQGLGYYSRARNMHFAANQIMNEFGGNFPKNFNDLKKLKVIGDYTAAAIASIAYNIDVPVVDGNVQRFISRLFNIQIPVDSKVGMSQIREMASQFIYPETPGDSNQSLMEFGALQCLPQNPHCNTCVFSDLCEGLKNKSVNMLPVKSTSVKRAEMHFWALFILSGNKILMSKNSIPSTQIWKNLFTLPLIPIEDYNIIPFKIISENLGISESEIKLTILEKVKHVLTHRDLNITFLKIEVDKEISVSEIFDVLDIYDLQKYPLPRVFEKFFQDNKLL